MLSRPSTLVASTSSAKTPSQVSATSSKPALPGSPTKEKLLDLSKKLPRPVARERKIIGHGDQSIVLEDGHKDVLIVTRYLVAKRFELLRHSFADYKRVLPFHIPQFVCAHQVLAHLHNPHMNPKTEAFFKRQYQIYGQLLTENYVYRIPRYEGTLEDLMNERFNEKTIEILEQTMLEALSLLHEHNLTHNDLSAKNIFFQGVYPNIKFILGDFGSITHNKTLAHEAATVKDLSKLEGIINKIKAKYLKKYTPYMPLSSSLKLAEQGPRQERANAFYKLRKK